jgi:hypothetical protein
METRDHRRAEFQQGAPPPNKLLQVLAEDQSGTYVLSFPCEWQDGVWQNAKTVKAVEAKIVGWRKTPRVR